MDADKARRTMYSAVSRLMQYRSIVQKKDLVLACAARRHHGLGLEGAIAETGVMR